MLLNVIKHLLPRGRAWSIDFDKPMRKFFAGIAQTFEQIRIRLQLSLADAWPSTTTCFDEFDDQFGLMSTATNGTSLRERIAGAWLVAPGQGIQTFQDALQENGFSVYVHNWWVPGTEPAPGQTGTPTIRDPGILLSNAQAQLSRVDAGEPLAEAGEPLAQAGETFIDPPPPLGFLLVNIIQTDTGMVEYAVPTDSAQFPHVIYVGGETFGNFADVPAARQDEFERLCLRLRPAHKWLGMLVRYT